MALRGALRGSVGAFVCAALEAVPLRPLTLLLPLPSSPGLVNQSGDVQRAWVHERTGSYALPGRYPMALKEETRNGRVQVSCSAVPHVSTRGDPWMVSRA